MGFREADLPLGFGKGVAQDCMICHGGSIAGQSYVGLGNSTLDFQTFSEDLSRAMGRSGKTPFTFSNVRGTTEAGGFAVFLLGYREPDLSLRFSRLDLDLHDDMCEDPPAWWLLKKKKTMYYDGGGDQRSVRSIMQFMMSPLNFAVRLQDGRAGFQGHPRVPSEHSAAEVSAADRREPGGSRRGPLHGQLRPLPRDLRRELDLP